LEKWRLKSGRAAALYEGMPVSFFDLSRQHEPLQEAFQATCARVLESNRFVLGPDVQAFEEEVAGYLDSRYAIGLSSGTDALLVAMMALGIGPGDEVLVPSFTFFGTAGSIVRTGATPVWVDVREDTFNIDLADAEAKLSPRCRAIVPVHLFGQPADMECVMALAGQNDLYVLEDVAQAIGATYQGTRAGTFGEFGALSFYPTKNLGGFGDGGMLVTDDAALAETVVRLRNHGMYPKYVHPLLGGNFRLDSIQAALLRDKLPCLDGYHAARREHAEAYLSELAGLEGIAVPKVSRDADSVWNQFTIRVLDGRREDLRAFLQDRGIGTEIYYPYSLPEQECFAGIGRGGESLPNAPRIAREVLSLPCFPELKEQERSEVVEAVTAFSRTG
jgi:dTDP-4-amino-4,6-dideoxygalactose transaminase